MPKPFVQSARQLVRRWRASQAASLRVPPDLKYRQPGGSPGRVYYLSPDSNIPSGGIRVIYRHVDLLNELGFDATVLHHKTGFQIDWFAHRTRVAGAREVELSRNDILVVPEFYAANLHRLTGGPRLVLFNQGAYHTYAGFNSDQAAREAQFPIEAVLTISEDSLALLQAIFETTKVHYVRSVVDPEVFHPFRQAAGRRRLAYITSRREIERRQLLPMLAGRPALAGWEQMPIQGVGEREVAELLRGSAIFLSFSQLDGFGLPPAEAMACGSYVIGFHGQGGREFFDPAYCQPIEDANLLDFMRAVERAAVAYDADPEAFSRSGLAASKAILERYDVAGLKDDLLAFYTELGLQPSR